MERDKTTRKEFDCYRTVWLKGYAVLIFVYHYLQKQEVTAHMGQSLLSAPVCQWICAILFSIGLQQLMFLYVWVITGLVCNQKESGGFGLPNGPSAPMEIPFPLAVVHVLFQSLPEAMLPIGLSNIKRFMFGTKGKFAAEFF